jgi:hypothetical protein
LVCCTKKNLATLARTCFLAAVKTNNARHELR